MDFYKIYSKHRFEWNYVLIKDINDTKTDAVNLISYIDKTDLVKITEFNEIENCIFKPSNRYLEFTSVLDENNINYKLFKSSGKNIGAGCGQMVTHYYKLKIKRNK